MLVCTDGSKGTWDPEADETELIAARQLEQKAAAKALGAIGEVGFLGWPDGELASGLEHGPRWPGGYGGRGRTWCSVTTRGSGTGSIPTTAMPAGCLRRGGGGPRPQVLPRPRVPHHRPDRLLLFEADQPDHVEDVTGHLEDKYRALLAHESQFESTMKAVDDEQLAAFGQRILPVLPSRATLRHAGRRGVQADRRSLNAKRGARRPLVRGSRR